VSTKAEPEGMSESADVCGAIISWLARADSDGPDEP
jgi:hypothetical protein